MRRPPAQIRREAGRREDVTKTKRHPVGSMAGRLDTGRLVTNAAGKTGALGGREQLQQMVAASTLARAVTLIDKVTAAVAGTATSHLPERTPITGAW